MTIADNIFKEYDIRGKYPQEITLESAYVLGLAFVKVNKIKKIVIGRDARQESEAVFWSLVSGLISAGAKVFDLGVCSTPELFFAVGYDNYDAGCIVTASHSPKGETGFKFCGRDGVVFGLNTGLKKIKNIANKELLRLQKSGALLTLPDHRAKIKFVSVAEDYKKFIHSFVDVKKMSEMKIIIDASNGSGSRLAETVMSDLPLKCVNVNFGQPDKYPDHGPNPLLPENQKTIKRQIIKNRADWGVMFDGDGDRAIFFDERGKLIEPYYINCLLSEIMLKRYGALQVVIDARLGLALSEVIKFGGGKVLRHRSGYANFIKTMKQKNLMFGCENSGHFMFNFRLAGQKKSFVYGEAILPILLVAQYLGEKKISLATAVSKFQKQYAVSGEINFATTHFSNITKILKNNFVGANIDELDGLSVSDKGGEWFFNLRSSHTEPLVRLNIEARNKIKLKNLKEEIVSLINKT